MKKPWIKPTQQQIDASPASDLRELSRYLDAQTATAECFSFDVFDTLVRRRVAPPDLVQVPAARAVVGILAERGLAATVDGVLNVRAEVYAELRDAAALRGDDPEAHIRDIVRVCPAVIHPSHT